MEAVNDYSTLLPRTGTQTRTWTYDGLNVREAERDMFSLYDTMRRDCFEEHSLRLGAGEAPRPNEFAVLSGRRALLNMAAETRLKKRENFTVCVGDLDDHLEAEDELVRGGAPASLCIDCRNGALAVEETGGVPGVDHGS